MKCKLKSQEGVLPSHSSLPRRPYRSCARGRERVSGERRLLVALGENEKRQGLFCEEREEERRRKGQIRVLCSALSGGERRKDDGDKAAAAGEETEATQTKAAGTLQDLSTKYGLTIAFQCFFFSWLAVVVLSRWLIPKMQRLKQTFQEDGPAAHASSKKGTPTAGGVLFIPVGLLIGLVYAWPLAKQKALLLGVTFSTLACHLIGGIDDAMIIMQKANKGLSPKRKLLLQMVTGVAFCVVAVSTNYTKIVECLPFLGSSAALAGLYYASALFLIAGESNAVNLTDGIDGLAAGLFGIAALGMALALTRVPFANQALALVCISMSGACCGFLSQNGHPAKIFMGDTGSLALGAFLSSVAVCTGSIVPFLFLTMAFNLEMFSVMVQVGYFKWTKARLGEGKRLFRMAPFHHHLELCGWSERKIVFVFYAVALASLLFCYGNPVLPI